MRTARLAHLGGALIQFCDYVPKYHGSITVPYENIAGLHRAVTERAADTGPLGYAEQLDIALQRTDGDVAESLWQLFITSRLYARWLDSKIINGMPHYSPEEKIVLMLEWRGAIAACKEPPPGEPQDPNGDTYYTWTHVLGKTAYSLAPEKETASTRSIVRVFERGTDLMHTIVHPFNKQSVRNSHRVAAAYGNAIGQTIVDTMQP